MASRFSATISKRIPVRSPRRRTTLLSDIRARKNGHSEHEGNLYSFAPVESTGWTTVIKQPRVVAYKPVHDLLQRMTILAGWLIVVTGDYRLVGRKILSTSKRSDRTHRARSHF